MSVMNTAQRPLGNDAHNHLDPRAQRSREALIDAMIHSLDLDPTPPSVSDLVRQAGASRPTFYGHFKDIPTLMHEAAMHRLDQVFESLPHHNVKSNEAWTASARKNFIHIFAHLHEYRAFYLAVLAGPSGRSTERALANYIAHRMLRFAHMNTLIAEAVGSDGAERYALFLAAGLVATATQDLSNNVSVTTMAATTIQFLGAATGTPAKA